MSSLLSDFGGDLTKNIFLNVLELRVRIKSVRLLSAYIHWTVVAAADDKFDSLPHTQTVVYFRATIPTVVRFDFERQQIRMAPQKYGGYTPRIVCGFVNFIFLSSIKKHYRKHFASTDYRRSRVTVNVRKTPISSSVITVTIRLDVESRLLKTFPPSCVPCSRCIIVRYGFIAYFIIRPCRNRYDTIGRG